MGVEELIRLENIRKEYDQGHVKIHALDGVDLRIDKGEFAAIMGPSGSGKSTLLHLLGFLAKPTSGMYFFQGRDCAGFGDEERASMRNQSIGFVFQNYNLLPRTSALDNVLLPTLYAERTDPVKTKARALALLDRVGMSHRLDNHPNQLSGGEQQRVAIARALINDPPLILADEPTGNLDSRTANGIMALLEELSAEGNTIVMVTHEEEIAERARRQIHVRDGKIA
jgi:putative ABC transport system ATP-binding protein